MEKHWAKLRHPGQGAKPTKMQQRRHGPACSLARSPHSHGVRWASQQGQQVRHSRPLQSQNFHLLLHWQQWRCLSTVVWGVFSFLSSPRECNLVEGSLSGRGLVSRAGAHGLPLAGFLSLGSSLGFSGPLQGQRSPRRRWPSAFYTFTGSTPCSDCGDRACPGVTRLAFHTTVPHACTLATVAMPVSFRSPNKSSTRNWVNLKPYKKNRTPRSACSLTHLGGGGGRRLRGLQSNRVAGLGSACSRAGRAGWQLVNSGHQSLLQMNGE